MRAIVAIGLVAAMVACGGEPATGGVRGTVTAGPTCPVERPGSPCPPGVWTGTVRATSTGGTTYDTTTDPNGAYELHLPDGTYAVAPVVEGGGPPTPETVTVTVSAGAMQTLDLRLDTGIR
jgi:hypothetical protein